MSSRKLYNARHELFTLMLLCDNPEQAGKVLLAIPNVDFFATSWGREAYERVRERYRAMDISEGVLNFSSLVSDSQLSETTRERLESGRDTFKNEKIDSNEIVESMHSFYKLRKLNELSELINTRLLDEDGGDADTILGEVDDHLSTTKQGSADSESWFYHMGRDFNMGPVLERVLSDTDRQFVPTGVKVFDDVNGGFNYGSLVLLVGTTGGGKTLVAQNLGQNMAMYEDVVTWTLEMSEDEHVSRMLAREGEVDIAKITSKNWTESEKDRAVENLKKFHKKVKKQGNRYTVVRPDREVSVEDVINISHPYGYRVVIVDYAGLLSGADGDDQAKALGRIGRALKIYAATHKKVVILLAQGNEEGKTRYARALMEHANNMWSFVATPHTKEQGVIDVEQPKARNQDPTPFTLEVEYKFMKLKGDSASSVAEDKDEKPAKGKSKPSGSSAKSDKSPGDKNAGGKSDRQKYLDNLRNL